MSAILCYRNLIDAANTALFVPAGSLTGYPVDNLKTRQLARVLRLSTVGTPTIVVDFGAPRLFDAAALLGVNASARGTTDVLIEQSSNGSTWTGLTATTATDLGAPDLPRTIIARVRASGSKVTTRYLRITPNWSALDAYREIGRLYVADSVTIPQGCDAGWQLGVRDYGVLDRSAGLQYYADRRVRARVLTMPMTSIDTSIAFGFNDGATSSSAVPSLDDLINYAGTTGDILVAPRADSPLWLRRTAIYGHLAAEPAIRHVAGPNYECTLTVEEER